jgi:hypothetical protein
VGRREPSLTRGCPTDGKALPLQSYVRNIVVLRVRVANKAREAMYKNRLKKWSLRKYNTEATMAVQFDFVRDKIFNSRSSSIIENGRASILKLLERYILHKGITRDELLGSVNFEAPGSSDGAPFPFDNAMLPTSGANQIEDPNGPNGLISQPASNRESESSSTNCRYSLTPLTTEPSDQGERPNMTPLPVPEPHAQQPSTEQSIGMGLQTTDSGSVLEFRTMQIEMQSHQNRSHAEWEPEHFGGGAPVDLDGIEHLDTDPAALDISGYASPHAPNMDFHTLLAAAPSGRGLSRRCRAPVHGRDVPQNLDVLFADIVAEPMAFSSLCNLFCIYRGQNRHQEADYTIRQAYRVYGSLIQQRHEQALACLNLVLNVLFMHNRTEEAREILQGARDAAVRHLDDEDPIVITINFMIQQSASTVKESGIDVNTLRKVYRQFFNTESLEHPFTLLAGYNLAWRLAMDDNTMFEAYHILSTIQQVAERRLSKTHSQLIAILITKARVIHDLGQLVEGERAMSEAMKSVAHGYHELHPYHLEAKRRHAGMLSDIGCVEQAQHKLKEVAIGRVEVLGCEHPFSRASVSEVRDFLSDDARVQELQNFDADLTRATKKFSMRTPIFDF